MDLQKILKAKKNNPARLEKRLRVTFFLAAEKQQEINAVKDIIYYLRKQYIQRWNIPIAGFAHSAVYDIFFEKDPIFIGRYCLEGVPIPQKYEDENVVLFMVDFVRVSKKKLNKFIMILKKEIFSTYAKYGKPQEEIWMVKQDVYKLPNDDTSEEI